MQSMVFYLHQGVYSGSEILVFPSCPSPKGRKERALRACLDLDFARVSFFRVTR